MLANEKGEAFAGIGVLGLLDAIREHGSIHHAAKTCGLSYVKAWGVMNRLERELGRPVLTRMSGGVRGGGAQLTPFGERFLKAFTIYHQQVQRAADTGLRRFLDHMEEKR